MRRLLLFLPLMLLLSCASAEFEQRAQDYDRFKSDLAAMIEQFDAMHAKVECLKLNGQIMDRIDQEENERHTLAVDQIKGLVLVGGASPASFTPMMMAPRDLEMERGAQKRRLELKLATLEQK